MFPSKNSKKGILREVPFPFTLCPSVPVPNFTVFWFAFLLFIFVKVSRHMCIFLFPLLSYAKGDSIEYMPFCTLLFSLKTPPGNHCILIHRDSPHSFLQLHSTILYGYTIVYSLHLLCVNVHIVSNALKLQIIL